ncbi:FAD-dependent oxidoreductase [Nonomuraea sp. NPDC050451]|uniref:FAD-dependent oxidoreductase n=1 Tax=Nonomuraea sp. NPDC050451 TaxID=3364364 RepID=UPI00379A80E8
MGSNTYDVVVIGAGPVGENVADRVVQGRLSAAIVERELVGKECSYWACMPTKALRAARQVQRAREAVTGDDGVPVTLTARHAWSSRPEAARC